MCQRIIRVRQEIIQCKNCGRPNKFIYLSDFSYGQRLIRINAGTEYVLIDLTGDPIFEELYNSTIEVLTKFNFKAEEHEIAEIWNRMLGICCDPINGIEIDTSLGTKVRCFYCGSNEYETFLLEPVQFVDTEVWIPTHNNWLQSNDFDHQMRISKELKKLNYI
jgi:hypothetical protein